MAKRNKLLLIITCVFAFCAMVFAVLNTSSKAYADIEGLSANNYYLTGYSGSKPYHYFNDELGNSTLENCEIEQKDGQKFYTIVPEFLVAGKTASGIAYVNLTSDIVAMINKGVVYANASAFVDSYKDNEQSRVTITLILGDEQHSLTSDKGIGLHNVAIENVLIPNDVTKIGFKFELYQKASVTQRPDFALIEPRIYLNTILGNNDLILNNEDASVNPGDIIKLNTDNKINNIDAIGNFINYSKINHEISYEVLSGAEYVTIIGDYLYIDDNAPNNAVISVRAKCRKNSYNNDYIYSKQVDYVVDAQSIILDIITDFENPATIYGEGQFYPGEKSVLQVVPNAGYTFVGWYINDVLVSNARTYIYSVNMGDKIKAQFVKTITIKQIVAEDKIYDGTDNVLNYLAVFDGLENGHDLYLENITVKFANKNVGENKVLIIEGLPTLAGENKDIYQLSSLLIPSSYGNIYKRDVYVTPSNLSKQYGDIDPTLTYSVNNIVEGETLTGSLSREEGEGVGLYQINLGNLNEVNPNYNVILDVETGIFFTINKRDVAITNIIVEPKIYDGTVNAVVSSTLSNTIESDDIDYVFNCQFDSANSGNVLINIIDAYLIGNDVDNYNLLPITEPIYGNILAKSINVIAHNKQVIYGEQTELTYTVEGLIADDELLGNLVREEGQNVGNYNILIGSLNNPNYVINYTGAVYTISKRPIKVSADYIVKEYLDADPILTYQVENIVEGETLNGNLSREPGEIVGQYIINQGTLTDNNYDITFVENVLEIIKRKVTFAVSLNDKIYDGNTYVTYSYTTQNVPQNYTITYSADHNTIDANAGINKQVIISNELVLGDSLEYFDININYVSDKINIDRKEAIVSIDNLSKIYGDSDPIITFAVSGLIGDDICIGSPKRNVGENVGEYSYYLDTLNNDNNPNYNIILDAKNFVIVPRDLELQINAQEKYFGDSDPEFSLSLSDGYALYFDDTLDSVLSGSLIREEGEYVGQYLIKSNVTSNANYNLINISQNYLTIIKRPITIVADDLSKIYGEEDPEFTYEVDNDVEGEIVVLQLKRTYGENVGEYEITYTTLNDARYNITFVSAKLTIIPSDITIKAESKIKTYGDEDPYFDVSIVAGLLKNNDVLTLISQGELVRESGEDVGEYNILQGTFNLGKNYNVTYLSNTMTIVKHDIHVMANAMQKSYGNDDPYLEYSILDGQLQFNDKFSGTLEREIGELVGEYNISIGTLSINDNYNITFTPSTFTIVPRDIIIIPQVTSKYYGEEDPIITYDVIGELVGDDKLDGELYREKPTTSQNPLLYENVGEYKIYCNLNDSNYNVIFNENYFTIMPRVVVIKADSYEIIYGQSEPELEYHIVSGDILEEDSLTGNIYRVPGSSAGIYDIRSSLTLGKNYKIEFQKGTFTIKPIEIIIESSNYSKVYGEIDPLFDYKITEGALINGDQLIGGISRVQGEDVGTYKLVSTLSNINYNVTLKDAYLTIMPKEAYLLASVHDKVYDGTNIAHIKTPVVTGLIDEGITISYDKENSAYFTSKDVNYDIPVVFHDIILVGEKASNYTLVLPTDVVGNITYNEISSENVSLSTNDNAILKYGTTIKSLTFDIDRTELGLDKMTVITGYNIWLENNGENTKLTNTVTLKMSLPKKYANRNNVYVYRKGDDGDYYLVSSKNVDGQVVITTDVLGEFVILTDNDAWIDIGSYVSIGILAIAFMGCIMYVVKKKKPTKNKKTLD